MQGGFCLGNLPAQYLVRHRIVSLELLDLRAAKGMIYVRTGIGHVAAARRTPACDGKWLGRPSIRLDARSWKRGAAGHKYARRFLLRQPPSSASGPPQHSVLGVAGLTRCKGHDICVCTGIGHVAAARRTPACDRKLLGRPSIRLDARSWKRGAADTVPVQKGSVSLGIRMLANQASPAPEFALSFLAA